MVNFLGPASVAARLPHAEAPAKERVRLPLVAQYLKEQQSMTAVDLFTHVFEAGGG